MDIPYYSIAMTWLYMFDSILCEWSLTKGYRTSKKGCFIYIFEPSQMYFIGKENIYVAGLPLS